MTRRQGTHSIRPVKDSNGTTVKNKWQVTVHVANPYTGEKKHVGRRFSGTKRDAEKFAQELAADPASLFEDPGAVAPETFTAYASEWLERRHVEIAAGTLKESTFENYAAHARTLMAHLGETPLQDINARLVNKVLADIRREKSERLGRQVSESTMQKVFVTVNQVMKSAYCEDVVPANPCDKALKPKAAKSDRGSLSASEARRLLDAVRTQGEEAMSGFYEKEARLRECGHANKQRGFAYGSLAASRIAAVGIGLWTGLRLGEVLALRWCDVDLVHGVLTVSHSMTGRGELTDTKTHQVRRVPIGTEMVDELRRLRRFRSDVMAAASGVDAVMVPAGQHVICSNTFGPLDKNNFGTWWRSWCRANGFEGLKFHELRHTCGSLLMDAGVPLTAVQRILGHASAKTTADYYLHPDDVQVMAAPDTLAAFLNGPDKLPDNVMEFRAVG